MYEHQNHFQPPQDHAPFRIEPAQTAPEAPAADEAQPGREADPYEVIDFLLKKVEEQQNRLTEQDGFITLQDQEIEGLKGQLEASKKELEAQLADYDVLMQNTLMVEHELEQFKQKSHERPKIQLPFYAEQKLAKLGYGQDEQPMHEHLEARQAV